MGKLKVRAFALAFFFSYQPKADSVNIYSRPGAVFSGTKGRAKQKTTLDQDLWKPNFQMNFQKYYLKYPLSLKQTEMFSIINTEHSCLLQYFIKLRALHNNHKHAKWFIKGKFWGKVILELKNRIYNSQNHFIIGQLCLLFWKEIYNNDFICFK